jgi:GNAT superfamily N-acetyltransferase
MTTIRITNDDDAETLPDIEQSAGLAFREVQELAWIADDENQTVERHRQLIAKGACWVAVDRRDRPIAFLSAEIADDALHIWELDVRRDRQGSGIGRALLETAIEDARRRGLVALTLTTFRDVAWNAPFYRKLGFQVLDDAQAGERLADLLRQEAEHGMPAGRRCAMRLVLSQG